MVQLNVTVTVTVNAVFVFRLPLLGERGRITKRPSVCVEVSIAT